MNNFKELDINKQYIQYFNKQSPHIIKNFKLTNESQIKNAIFESSKNHGLSRKTPCVFNSDSLMNWIRINESNVIYIDESQKKTSTYMELEKQEKQQYLSTFKNSEFIMTQVEKCFNFSTEYIDSNNVSGLAYVNAMVDTHICDIEKFVNLMSRRADLLGYNYVDHEIEMPETLVEYNNKKFKCAKVLIQFEASYVDSATIPIGRFLYHVTSKQVTEKIFKEKTGLIAGNKNTWNFYYPSRVYCFVDRYNELEKLYVQRANKVSKKFVDKDKLTQEVKEYFIELQNKLGKGILYDSREFCVLQIDTAKLTHAKFFRDNTFNINNKFIAVYTQQSIPYTAIEVVDEFHL